MNDIAIKVDHVSKLYKLYNKPIDRMKESLRLVKGKCYREHYALKDLDFEVRRGETVGIIGTNGSGKSTILKIITGVLNPTEGQVIVDGRISALLELGAGFNGEYSGLENVYLNGTMIGFTREEIDQKLDRILEFADIGEFINQPVKTYSSGMFVRLAFAVAINIDPEILIVDEALSVGDVFFQAKCYRKFEEFKKQGRTILFVSHDLGSISKYCDRAILLNRGVKIAEGIPKDIIDMYKKVLVNKTDTPRPQVTAAEVQLMQEKQLWKNNLPINPNYIEYGDKEGEIIDFAIIDEQGTITNTIEKGTKFKIKMKVRFNKKINDPIFAFTIKDLQGTDVTGTNTFYEDIDTKQANAGDVQVIEFEQEMNLQGKQYLLSFGCTGYIGTDFTVYHRLYDVCNITVVSAKNTVGFYDMNSQISIK